MTETSFMSCYRNGYGLQPVNIVSKLSYHFNRRIDDFSENIIEETWTDRSSKNPSLFDASKFRLHSVELHPDDDATWCTLQLGTTSYKQFIGTNCAGDEIVSQLRQRGLQQYGDAQAFFSDALGVGALLETTDERLVLLKRSLNCGEAEGLLDRPGGHAEPKMVCGIEGDLEIIPENLVTNEIFDSIIREVVDEVNIARCKLSVPILIGFVYNNTTASRPSAEFVIRCNLSSEQVSKDFKRGTQAEADESTDILFLRKDEIFNLASRKDQMWNQFAPAAQGSLLLYCDFLKCTL